MVGKKLDWFERVLANQMMEEERRRQQALQAAAVGRSRKVQAKPSVDADPDDPAGNDPEQEEMSFLHKVYDRTLKMANVVLPSTKKIGKQTSSPAYQDYRDGERNAEEIVAGYEQRKTQAATQDYRAGERNAEKIVTDYEQRKVDDEVSRDTSSTESLIRGQIDDQFDPFTGSYSPNFDYIGSKPEYLNNLALNAYELAGYDLE